MCLFITTAFDPHGVELDILTKDRPPLKFLPQQNRTVERSLRPNESYYSATSRYCDCDTALGRKHGRPQRDEKAESIFRKKRRREGWSEEKISRALEQMAIAQGARDNRDAKEARGEVDAWMDFLGDVVGTRGWEVALLLHEYSGSLDESFHFGERTVPVPEVTPEFLETLEKDVLYRIVPAPGHARLSAADA